MIPLKNKLPNACIFCFHSMHAKLFSGPAIDGHPTATHRILALLHRLFVCLFFFFAILFLMLQMTTEKFVIFFALKIFCIWALSYKCLWTVPKCIFAHIIPIQHWTRLWFFQLGESVFLFFVPDQKINKFIFITWVKLLTTGRIDFF